MDRQNQSLTQHLESGWVNTRGRDCHTFASERTLRRWRLFVHLSAYHSKDFNWYFPSCPSIRPVMMRSELRRNFHLTMVPAGICSSFPSCFLRTKWEREKDREREGESDGGSKEVKEEKVNRRGSVFLFFSSVFPLSFYSFRSILMVGCT